MVDFNDELQRALAELKGPDERLDDSAAGVPPHVHARAVEILTTRLVQDGRVLGRHTPREYEDAVLTARAQIAEEPREALRRLAANPNPAPAERLFARA